MASYYYLVASLPMLRFEDNPPITLDQFLADCQQSMHANDYVIVRELVAGNLEPIANQSTYIMHWKRFLASLNGLLFGARSAALSREIDDRRAVTDADIHLQDIVKQAMQAENPLEAELLLMHFQWKMAEELSQSHVFSLEVLLTYAIQLALLERKSLFTPIEGNAEFKRLFSNLQSIIKSI